MDSTSDEDERGDMSTWTQDDVVLAVGNAPGEGLRIPAELLPPEYREDGSVRVVASVDREGVLGDWW